MADPTPAPANPADVYLDPDRARALALEAQEAVKNASKDSHEARERRPELGGASDEASVAVKEALLALLEGSRGRDEAASEKADDTLASTFSGIDLTTGTDTASGDDIGKVMR
ncbi:hypothetical protein Srot_2401 [Segniliparus rotundus DSM 44985]|uniref:Uncharacterized protein n=1 Tax=Segniliparus rotundus (strain ATCC BAA-972 / CDC 1076 / CIP 108378 / DSM 44985 / JCM 13578) TaxID=640132 RepID=D6ZAV9_SEGRD|nr:hypothetical protein [Segniliparus rotundus]ADG98845.1 hypothetical protein Srot_2401 [Segniliparus rotundus DSM 44985]